MCHAFVITAIRDGILIPIVAHHDRPSTSYNRLGTKNELVLFKHASASETISSTICLAGLTSWTVRIRFDAGLARTSAHLDDSACDPHQPTSRCRTNKYMFPLSQPRLSWPGSDSPALGMLLNVVVGGNYPFRRKFLDFYLAVLLPMCITL